MTETTTPMMKQYMRIKEKYADCLLFYRMGDFYELFLNDAIVGAKILDITLTGKSNGKNSRIPMAGVPYHAVDSYLAKLVKAGYKVAICEQVSLPNKYGLVEREVVRIVTPGTVLDEKTLEKKDNNYIVSVAVHNATLGISTADLSTGFFQANEIASAAIEPILIDELNRISPKECILPPELYNNPDILKIIRTIPGINIYCYQDWESDTHTAEKFLKDHFHLSSLNSFGLEDKPLAQQTAAALLAYLEHTQQGTVEHIQRITVATPDSYMHLDRATMINLELFTTIREHNTKGSLFSILDRTTTAMGGRMLKNWIKKPLIKQEEILKRHDAVEELLEDTTDIRYILNENLKQISDIERTLSRLSVGIGNARDLIHLRDSLHYVITIKNLLQKTNSTLITQLAQAITPEVESVITLIQQTIHDEPGIDIRNGNLIKSGVSKELDTLRQVVQTGKDWIAKLEEKERQRTGISSLKVRYNKVFGFYIEISKANLHLIPDNFIRKQTLVNGERFITPELKEQEEIILSAEEKIFTHEYLLFQETVKKVISQTPAIQKASEAIATIDCLYAFADLAEKNRYCRPTLNSNGKIDITAGRHPVVEKLLAVESQFVPNDIMLDTNQQIILLTGPNMAGKSVLIRQTSLICLLNQIGSFVPADAADLCVLDRIFVRSGASDVITSGLSTFMVEMVETAHILHHATSNSLIIMDEIGRGTSTYDGLSIAWAVVEYLVTNGNFYPKTLFATHYHELQELEKLYPEKIANYHMAVVKENEQPIFLHLLKKGGASSSFGIAVAELAGIPDTIINNANTLLTKLEKHSSRPDNSSSKASTAQTDWDADFPKQQSFLEHIIVKEVEAIDIHQLTPLAALNTLAELKNKIKLLHGTAKEFIA